MIINSEYTIAQYDGKMDLALTGVYPAPHITIGSIQDTQYRTFINNIKAIYASQQEDGTIPIFYKNSDNTINTSGSTLTSLKSSESYYFVSYSEDPNTQNKTIFPYTIPSLSGTVCGTADGALVNFDHASVLYVPTDGCATPLPITATVSNTINGYQYYFDTKIVSTGNNSRIYPSGGSVVCNNNENGKIALSVLLNGENSAVLELSLKTSQDDSIICTDTMALVCGDDTYITALSSQAFNTLSSTDNIDIQSVSSNIPAYVNIGKPDIKFALPKINKLNNTQLKNPIPLDVVITNTKKDNYAYTYNFTLSSSTLATSPTITPTSGNIYANTYKNDDSSYSSGDFSCILEMKGAKDVVVNVDLIDKGKIIDSDSISFYCENCADITNFDSTLLITPSTTTNGESLNSVTFKSNTGDSFSFNGLIGGGIPNTMNLFLENNQVAAVTYIPVYNNKNFRYTYSATGESYIGVFSSGSLHLT